MMKRLSLCAFVFAVSLGTAQAGLQVGANRRWSEDDDRAVALFGSGLWTIIPDATVNIEDHNAWYAEWGANANRAALYSFFTAVPEGKGVGPWPRNGPGLANDGLPKFDLTRANQAFWDRLHAYLASCERHGIHVWLQMFCEP